jgi:MarR family transcriptional regulator, organic hydroperoxide resistance regulator
MHPPIAPASSAESLKLDNQLCFALYSASLAMTKAYKPLLGTLGITYPQYLVLLLLWEQDSQSVSALGERLFLDSGTLTPLLKRMELAGLLRRERSADDERRVRVWLTPQGQALRAQAETIPQCMLQAAACTLAELSTLTQAVQTLRDQLTGHALKPAAGAAAPAPISPLA